MRSNGDAQTQKRNNAPTRIIHIIDDLGLGGAQRQLVELAQVLDRKEFALEVVSLSSEKLAYAESLRHAGIPVHAIAHRGAWSWKTLAQLIRLLRARRPALVQTWLFTADLYGRLAARLARVPFVISAVRNVDDDKPWHYVAADRLLSVVTDGFMVNAHAVGQRLMARERVPAAKVRTIYNGVDLEAFHPGQRDGAVRSSLSVSSEAVLIGTVGRLAEQKDHATFVRAAAMVRSRLPEARFVIVGSGALRSTLNRMIGEMGLSGCAHILDGRPDIQPVLAALDVSVISSRYEGCCNVILESMAMAKPVIATAVGGNPELVVTGTTGMLVPANDPAALAEAIVRLTTDRTLARTMGQEGRRRVEESFSIARMAQATTAVYRQLIGTSECGGHVR